MQRSRARVLAIALASLALPVPRAAAQEGLRPYGPMEERPRLPLTFVDYAQLPAETLAAVQDHAAQVVAALGAEAEFATRPPGATLDPETVTLIVMNDRSPRQLRRGVMGAVQRKGSARVLWIYAGSVAAGTGLRWEDRPRWSAAEGAAFATAMARVAVHEVVHLVCPWRGHDAQGLMAGVLDREALTGSNVPVSFDLRRDFSLATLAMSGDPLRMARDGSPGPE